MQWNLSTVLANPRLLQAFESYLRKENDKLSIRGLIFIEALTQLRHETEPSNIEKGLHRIYNTFMAKGAKLELDNISTRDEIKAEIDHLHWAIVNQSDVERILIDTEKQINSALSEKLKQFFQSTHAEVRYGSETQQPSPDKARVVIVGGGFTGFTVAAVLDPMPLFHVTLIDTKDSFEYTPGIIKRMVSPEESTSMRVRHNSYLRNGRVIIGYAEEILQGARALRVNNDEIVPFDYLVIATGSAYASQLKSTDISTPYRLAGLNQVSSELIKAQKILVIGGGLVGCELASEIALKYPKKHVTIVESRSSIICRSDPDQQERAKKYLQDLGIELVLNERITDLSDFNQNKVYLGSSGNAYSGYDKVFMATGTRPNTDLLRNSTVYEPLMDCCLDDWGRIRVRPTLQLDHPRYNHIFAGGDATNVVEEKTGYAATLAGVCIARNICRIIKGKEPLRQGEKGTMPAPDQALHGISSQGGIGKQKLSALKKKFAFLNPTWAALKYFDEQQYLRMVQGEAMASSRVFGRLPRKLSTRKSFSNDRPVMKASVSWPSDETSSISSSSENSFQSLEEILNRHLGLDLSLDPKKADTAV